MGRIRKLNDRVEIRIGVDDALTERFAASRDVFCSLGMYVRKIAELKAEKLGVKLPSGAGSTTFDKSTGEYVVTFAESFGEVL